jgi:hypothetical protein
MMLDIAHRHPAGIERDDHLVQPAQAPLTGRHQTRGEAPVAVSRDGKLNIASDRGHRLGERSIAGVVVKRGFRIASFVADVLGQLRLQAPLEAGLDQLLD